MIFPLLFSLFLGVSHSFLLPRNRQIQILSKTTLGVYPLSPRYYEEYIRRLNSRNRTEQGEYILGKREEEVTRNILDDEERKKMFRRLGIFPIPIEIQLSNLPNDHEDDERYDDDEEDANENRSGFPLPSNSEKDDIDNDDYYAKKNMKSKNFQVYKKYGIYFKDVGGFDNIKEELLQCVDMLTNYKMYAVYNVRIPKGLILEGPPGTGKTLLAKAFAGECKCSFIPVSGADFQEKYVGVGSSRVKELFGLAKKNIPCIIFIDEIDAIGRKRSTDGESSSSERDNTLNSLLVELDGFKNNTGIFIIGATNRIDLLDSALLRPGRIDKKIYIGYPDEKTREAIINIHIRGKPYDSTILLQELIENTQGLTGAQIENLLNEAMLNALREKRPVFGLTDFDFVYNKMIAGWQPSNHQYTDDMIRRIAVHEMGHAIVGILSKYYPKMKKVVLNLSSPTSPGYTLFENPIDNLNTKESLIENLMILLGGRVAEELCYGESVTTGAIMDFEKAYKLAEKMILEYGMGQNVIYARHSDSSKKQIDEQINNLIQGSYSASKRILQEYVEIIKYLATLLTEKKTMTAEEITEIIIEYNDSLTI